MTDAADLRELDCACATARQLARIVTQLYDRHMDGTGLEAPQFALLATLRRHGPATQRALGRHHGMDKTTVSRNIGVLRKRGWVAASAGADRRERRVAITEAGRRMLQAAIPRWSSAQKALRSTMSAKEWDVLFAALRTTARAAQALHDGFTTEARATDSPRNRPR